MDYYEQQQEIKKITNKCRFWSTEEILKSLSELSHTRENNVEILAYTSALRNKIESLSINELIRFINDQTINHSPSVGLFFSELKKRVNDIPFNELVDFFEEQSAEKPISFQCFAKEIHDRIHQMSDSEMEDYYKKYTEIYYPRDRANTIKILERELRSRGLISAPQVSIFDFIKMLFS